MKKIISLIMVVLMVISILPMMVFAEELNQPVLTIESAEVSPGTSFDVNVNIKNNPGIISAVLRLTFDEGLTLVGAKNGNTFSTLSYTSPNQLINGGKITSGCQFMWSAADIADKDIKDGTIITLTFEMSEDAEIGDAYNIQIVSNRGDFLDKHLNEYVLSAQSTVTAVDYTPGDVNDDGVINMRDIVEISRYIVDGCQYDPDGYAVRVNENAANVNGDSSINMIDVVWMCRYIVDGCKTDPEGYNIKFVVVGKTCSHTLKATEEKDPTCTEEGNIAYWQCTKCNKYFADENANSQITTEDTVKQSQGHNNIYHEATDEYSAGTYCDKCDTWTSGHEKIEVNESSISYRHYVQKENGVGALEIVPDDYLASHPINNPNPSTYIEGKGIEELYQGYEIDGKKVSANGYTFVGWFEKPEIGANRVYSISASETGNKILHGVWTKNTYTITYDLGDDRYFTDERYPIDEETYKKYQIDEEKKLYVPKAPSGYIFAGWSNAEGEIVRQLPIGSYGNQTFQANWLSERNKAWTKTVLDEPIINEDDDYILFTYEIGRIDNVPLYTYCNFGYINEDGVSKEQSYTYTESVGKEEMESLSEYVSKATNESFAMTLSNEWTNKTTINEEWAKENKTSVDKAEEICKSEESGWYISSGKSGTDTTVTLKTDQKYDLTTTTNNKKDYTNEETGTKWDVSAGLDLNFKRTLGLTIPVGNGATLGAENEFSPGLSLKGSYGEETFNKHEVFTDDTTVNDKGVITYKSTDETKSNSWNESLGYNGNSSVEQTKSILTSVSESINNKVGYGEEYINSEDESKTQGFEETNTTSKEHSSAVTYCKTTTKEITETFKTENAKTGYHRWVMAGTAYVFGIVGYDIARDEFFVSTMSVVESDNPEKFEDYSYCSPNFDDNQGIISFEVPDDILDYVADRTINSEGLEVNANGEITSYSSTEGKELDEFVVVPEYMVVNKTNGSKAIKVTGISSEANVFKNNTEIKAIELSDYITTIPESAFEGCTSLLSFEGEGITSIGNRAFAGCTELKLCSLDENVTVLGEKAFEGVDTLRVKASNKNVLLAAIGSGAKNIEITLGAGFDVAELSGITLTIPDTVENFIFNGEGAELENCFIVSYAKQKTEINDTVFISTTKTPIEISSSEIALEEVSITSPYIGLISCAETATLSLLGQSNITSNGKDAILCKNLNLVKKNAEDNYNAKLVVKGNILLTGNMIENGFLNIDGEVKNIDGTEFELYKKGLFTLIFDSCGGTLASDQSTKSVYHGSKYGSLPTPTRDYYNFSGWYTAASGGEKVTADTVMSKTEDVTLYAQWTQKPVSDWVKASAMPAGAQVVETKWTYTLREYTTNSASSLSGWTKYDTKHTSWTAWGSWSAWSTTAVSKSDSRDVETKTVAATYKTQYNYSRYRSSDGWSGPWAGTWGGHYCGTYQERGWTDSRLAVTGRDGYGSTMFDIFGGAGDGSWYNEKTRQVQTAAAYTMYRYRDRSPVYTYYYYRDVNKEATSDPTNWSDTSNEIKWVKYRAK